MDKANPGEVKKAAEPERPAPKVAYYRGPVRRYGVRPTITGAVQQPDGSVARQALCGPIHLVFGTSPQGVCEVDEAFARQHRDTMGQPMTFEQMIAVIESSPAFGVEFKRISADEVFRLKSGGDKKLSLVRGAVSQSRKA